ncbi:MAG: hypothetical protein RJQ09_03420 [Cyclobacteriaceae bacterium]
MGIFKTKSRFSWIVLIYITFAICYILIAFNSTWIIKLFDGILNPSFFESLHASFVEDLIFFGIIGLAAFILTSRNPADEPIDSRLKSLFNGKNLTDNAYKHFRDVTTKMSFNKNSEVVFTLKKLSTNNEAVKVHIKYTGTIANLYKDLEFKVVDAFTVESGSEFDNSSGEITSLSFKAKETNEPSIYISGEVVELKPNSKWKMNVDEEVPRNGELIMDFQYYLWVKLIQEEESITEDHQLWHVQNTYTDRGNFMVQNDLDQDIRLNYELSDNLKAGGKLLNSKSNIEVAKNVSLLPKESIMLSFYLNKDILGTNMPGGAGH